MWCAIWSTWRSGTVCVPRGRDTVCRGPVPEQGEVLVRDYASRFLVPWCPPDYYGPSYADRLGTPGGWSAVRVHPDKSHGTRPASSCNP
jgi:hypothetical protein